MFSIMDFLPTFAHVVGGTLPTDRAIDGIYQYDVPLGESAMGHRESLLSIVGGDVVAVRWKQWRIYFTDVHPTGIGPQRQPGIFSAFAPLSDYPIFYNVEMDPHEDLVTRRISAGYRDPRSRSSRSTWQRSRSTPIRRRPASRCSVLARGY